MYSDVKAANGRNLAFGNERRLKIGIIGAGPAGSLAAHLFSKNGHNVFVLERRPQVERKVCGEYLCPMGVKLLEQLDILGFHKVNEQSHSAFKLALKWPKLEGMKLVSPKGTKVKCLFPALSGNEMGVSLNRKIFDEELIGLARLSGAKFIQGITVTEVNRKNNQWFIKLNKEEFCFDLLIVADGRQSKIGHTLGHIKKIYTDRAALHLYLPRHFFLGERMGEMHIFDDGSYCGINPITDQEVNFSIVIDSWMLKEKRPIEIINDYIAKSSDLKKSFGFVSQKREADIKVVTTLKNNNSFIAGNKLAYIGDAAGFIDPLTGEGIYNALFSAKLLFDSVNCSKSIELGLYKYKIKKILFGLEKKMLNNFFQFLIKQPKLVELVANFLKKSPKRSDVFIGIIGNIYGPVNGILKMLTSK